MVNLVANQQKTHGQHRQFGIESESCAAERGFVERFKQENGTGAHGPQFGQQRIRRTAAGAGGIGKEVFVVAGQAGVVVARKTQGTVGKNPLGIDDVLKQVVQRSFAQLVHPMPDGAM